MPSSEKPSPKSPSSFRLPLPGEQWRHFKGSVYTIDSIREDEDDNIVVCYGGLYTRKLTNFLARVLQGRRFVYVG